MTQRDEFVADPLLAVSRGIIRVGQRLLPGAYLARYTVSDSEYVALIAQMRQEFPGPLIYELRPGAAGAWMADTAPPNVYVRGVVVCPTGSVA
jgi:hypothetical protein